MIRKILAAIFLMSAVALTGRCAEKCTFAGGDEALAQWLAQNIKYPAICCENAIEGTVTVTFTVGADGSISNPSIVRPLDPDLEAEALRLLSIMPAWSPATGADGAPVSSQMTLPITFTLPD